MNRAVILARGLGRRMRQAEPDTVLDPAQESVAARGIKGMTPIGRPFLDYCLSALADAGFEEVCLVIGPEHHSVREYYEAPGRLSRIAVTFAVQEEPRGTADAVLAAETFADRMSGETTAKLRAARPGSLSEADLRNLDALWRASNYLSVGQIYLLDNPLLRKPLAREQVKPRLLGHWGTTPGLNFLYVHLNRAIKQHDLDMLYVIGPGHGGPALVAHAYLEGTYSEYYQNISQDADGMKRLFKQFSYPGGIPSHVAPDTPGSIHEGGELGYALSHAYGAAFTTPT